MIRENNKKKIFFTLAQTFKGHRGPVYSIACDDQFLYSSAGDKFVTRWNLITGEQDSFVIKLEHASYAIYTDRFSNYIHVACNDGTIHIVDKESRRLIYSVNIGKHKIFYLKERVSNKDLYIVNEVGACCVINIEKKQISIEQNSINAKVRRFLIFEDQLIVPDSNGMVHFIDARSLKNYSSIKITDDSFTAVLINKKLNYLILGSKNAMIYLLDLDSKKISFKIPAHNFVLYDLIHLIHFGISCSRDKTIKVWNENFTEVLQRIDLKHRGHKYSVNQICPVNENSFASCSDDGTIKLFRSTIN